METFAISIVKILTVTICFTSIIFTSGCTNVGSIIYLLEAIVVNIASNSTDNCTCLNQGSRSYSTVQLLIWAVRVRVEESWPGCGFVFENHFGSQPGHPDCHRQILDSDTSMETSPMGRGISDRKRALQCEWKWNNLVEIEYWEHCLIQQWGRIRAKELNWQLLNLFLWQRFEQVTIYSE